MADDPGIDEATKLLLRIESRLSSLEARMDALEKWIDELRAETMKRLESIEKKIDELEEAKRTTTLKWVALILAMILSFFAAMLGFDWWPP